MRVRGGACMYTSVYMHVSAWCEYMHVCVYMYLCIWCMSLHMCMHIMGVYVHMCMCVDVCTPVGGCMSACVCVCGWVGAYLHVYGCVHAHVKFSFVDVAQE